MPDQISETLGTVERAAASTPSPATAWCRHVCGSGQAPYGHTMSLHTDDRGSGWDGHLLLLHSTDEQRVSGLTAWVRRGLERGEKIIYVEAATTARPFMVTMEEQGVDATAAVRDGRLEVLPFDGLSTSSDEWDVVERARAEGFSAVRVSGEASAALTRFPPEVHLEYERGMDELVRTRPVHALCQYPRSATTGARLSDTVAVHLAGVRQGMLTTDTDQHGLNLRGELDRSNTDVLSEVLRAAGDSARQTASGEPAVLTLNLAAVAHMDAGSCRHLATDTADLRSEGGRVVLGAPQPAVHRVLRILEIDTLPGIQLIERR
jgi:anti-anti-sigma factor